MFDTDLPTRVTPLARTLLRALPLFVLLNSRLPGYADVRSSADYSISTETFDSGGQRSLSSNYENQSSLCPLVADSSLGGLTTTAEHGYFSQIFEVISVSIIAAPSSVLANNTSQLSALALLDDGTFLTLAGTNIDWETPSFPILGISPSGLAFMGSPQTNTVTEVGGDYLGVGGESLVLVRADFGLPDGASAHVVSGPRMEHGQFVVSFAGAPGRVFTIESSADLRHWQKVTNLVAPTIDMGSGVGVFQFTMNSPNGLRLFFRTVYPAY